MALFMTEQQRGKVDPVDEQVGKRLKMRRVMLGLSQQDLGNAVNVSIQQIQKYEKATNRISSGRLFAFSKMLSVPIEFFFKDTESPANENVAYDEVEEFETNLNSVSEKDVLSLVRFFSSIEQPEVRKKIVDLVKSLAN